MEEKLFLRVTSPGKENASGCLHRLLVSPLSEFIMKGSEWLPGHDYRSLAVSHGQKAWLSAPGGE